MDPNEPRAIEPIWIGAALFFGGVTDDKARIAAKVLATAPASLLNRDESIPVASFHEPALSDGSAAPCAPMQQDEVATSSNMLDASPLTSRPTPESLSWGAKPHYQPSGSSLVDFVTPRSIVLFVRLSP